MSDNLYADDGAGRTKVAKVNYPSNSAKMKDEPKKPLIEKVVTTGGVHQRQKPIVGKIVNSIVEERSGSVMEYIAMEVLLPAAKDMIIDAFSQGIQRLFYGDSRSRRAESRGGYTNYSKLSRPSEYEPRRELSRRERAAHDFDDLVIRSRGEAEDVLDRMRDLVRDYGAAKVTDLYDLVGLSGSYVDDRWGWTDLRDARVKPVRGGYLLELPRTEPLES